MSQAPAATSRFAIAAGRNNSRGDMDGLPSFREDNTQKVRENESEFKLLDGKMMGCQNGEVGPSWSLRRAIMVVLFGVILKQKNQQVV